MCNYFRLTDVVQLFRCVGRISERENSMYFRALVPVRRSQ